MATSDPVPDSRAPKSFLLPIMATAVAAGLVRMVLRKRKDDRAAQAAAPRSGRRG